MKFKQWKNMGSVTKIKLYKFRSLGDCVSVERTKEIIETGEFWCSPLWEQNDSMEGVYSYWQSRENPNVNLDIYSQKNSYRICSFSGKRALKDPKMWGYYGNGFKGLAVEIEISSDKIRKVDYQNSLLCEDTNSPDIKKIITTKLKSWKSEDEYRFLIQGANGNRKIGKITGVYFGDPYGSLKNTRQILENSSKLQEYICRKEEVIKLCRDHKYPCFTAGFVNTHGKWKISCKAIS